MYIKAAFISKRNNMQQNIRKCLNRKVPNKPNVKGICNTILTLKGFCLKLMYVVYEISSVIDSGE